jgi:ribonuclease HII
MAKQRGRDQQLPTLTEELKLICQGYRFITGIDEAGRGAIAGPVVAGAVILPQSIGTMAWSSSVRDSKELSPSKRCLLFDIIVREAVAVGIGIVDSETIDTIGILAATKLAMCRAVGQLVYRPDFLLIDCVTLPQLTVAQKSIIKGDKLSLSIACASIVAKVTRDRIMIELDQCYPGYGLADHKGYGTGQHLAQLRRLGPSPIHRCSFAPVRELIALP